MEQIQKRYIKFFTDTLGIVSIGKELVSEEGFTILPVELNLVKPFFTLEKNINNYLPVVQDNFIIGFKCKEGYEPEIVINSDVDSIQSLRSFENFIVRCDIRFTYNLDNIVLLYDATKFNDITNQENIERLTSAQDKVYNMYVTRKGDPFTIYATYETTLSPFLTTGSITLPYNGERNISIYAIAKD